MSILGNLEKNIYFSLDLVRKEGEGNDYETNIFFELTLLIDKNKYSYLRDKNMSLTKYELNHFIENVKKSVENYGNTNKFENIYFFSSEAYFEFNILYGGALDEIEVVIWLNIGGLSDGQEFGYDKGFRFSSNVRDISRFIILLEEELLQLF